MDQPPATKGGGEVGPHAGRRRGRQAVIQPGAALLEERSAIVALGTRLRSKRLELGFTLDQVVERVKDRSKGYIISAAQISRIESGNAEPGFYQLSALAAALNLSVEELSREKAQFPWYIFSAEDVDFLLRESLEGNVKYSRHDGAHDLMIENKVYYPVPLNRDKATVGNDARMDPQMSVNVLQIHTASKDLMNDPKALDRHPGEEVIYVISGELQFWYEETPENAPIHRTLNAGDCLHYSSGGRHAFRAIGTEPARALFVYAKPPQGTVPSAYTKDGGSSSEAQA